MVLTLYDEFLCLPGTEADWANEYKGFIENYELPGGTWDEYHFVCCLQNYFSFKNIHGY